MTECLEVFKKFWFCRDSKLITNQNIRALGCLMLALVHDLSPKSTADIPDAMRALVAWDTLLRLKPTVLQIPRIDTASQRPFRQARTTFFATIKAGIDADKVANARKGLCEVEGCEAYLSEIEAIYVPQCLSKYLTPRD